MVAFFFTCFASMCVDARADERKCVCELVCAYVCLYVDRGDNHKEWNTERWPKGWFGRSPLAWAQASTYFIRFARWHLSILTQKSVFISCTHTENLHCKIIHYMGSLTRFLPLFIEMCVCVRTAGNEKALFEIGRWILWKQWKAQLSSNIQPQILTRHPTNKVHATTRHGTA